MAVTSSGCHGDQVMLTSVLYEFQQPAALEFDYLMQESESGASGSLSVYLLSTHRVPTKLDLNRLCSTLTGGWRRACVCIPSGTYRVMFLATLGLPHHSDVYLDNIQLAAHYMPCYTNSIRPAPAGNFIFFINGRV